MNAAVLEALEKMVVKEVATPEAGPGELLVRVKACAVCGSDLRIFHHGNPRVNPPQVIGHEIAGEVAEVGEGVQGFEVGDRVAVGADVPCGVCPECRETYAPPAQLLRLPARKVIGLRVNVSRLLNIREHRVSAMNLGPLDDYLDKRAVAREVNEANRLMEEHGWRGIDVSYMAIEEIAKEVLKMLGRRRRSLP